MAVEDVQVASPGPREVLIRTAAVGVCRSDLHFVDGTYPTALPTVPGHEAAGIVEAVGSEVHRVRVGDPVITCLSAFCGQCEFCVTGRLSLCVDESTKRRSTEPPRLSLAAGGDPVHQYLNLSAFAETMLVHEHACQSIDPAMPLDRAALIGCAVLTGAGTVWNAAKVQPGETVAVIGCGGVGLAAINAAAITGAGRIVAVDPVPEKLELARKLGATDTVQSGEHTAEELLQLTRGGVDHALECVGRTSTAELAFHALKRGGTATVVGMIPPGEEVKLPGWHFLAEKKIQGSLLGSNRFPVDIPRLVDFYLRGKLDLDSLVAERIGLGQVNEAMGKLRSGDSVRSVITFG